MPAHVHDYPFVSFVLSGGYEEKIGGRSRERMPKTLIFHPAREGHAVKFFDTQTRIFQVRVESVGAGLYSDFRSVFEDSFSARSERLTRIAARIYDEYKRSDGFSDLAIHGLMLEMLAEVGRFKLEKRNTTGNPGWLERIKEILRDDFSSKTSLDEIAGKVDVHPVYLSREFRRLTGCTIGEFVRRLRVEEACRKLSRTETKLSEIAVEVGFYDQSHFTNAFKSVTGMTPAEYRSAFR